jgi:fructose-specific component phosphotransferase system IIB-like protein
MEAATREAVQQWMDQAAGAEAVATYGSSAAGQAAMGPPATRSGSTELDSKMALLAKPQATLNTALQHGRENPVDRAI